ARAHVYAAGAPEDQTQRQLVRDLLDRAFGGSATKLVMHALSARKTSREELARIREMLDRLEGGKQ
ncbi:MAG: transcriptional regulator, partial [Acidobacteria bacterium]